MPFYAHSENGLGGKHDLVTHLERITEQAGSCAATFGAVEVGYWVGLKHDLGELHTDFHTYFISVKSSREPNPSTAEQDRH